MNQTNKKRIFIVLTTGRSGSSMLVKLLESLDIYCCDQLRINKLIGNIKKSNPKGHYENIHVLKINERILIENNIAWFSINKTLVTDNTKYKLAIKKFFGELKQIPTVLKDPRFCSTVRLWKNVANEFNIEPIYIFLSRDPNEFIDSMIKRDNLTKNESEALWMNDTVQILHFLKKEPFFFFTFKDVINSPENLLKQISKKINVKINHANLKNFKENFIDKSLFRSKNADQSLSNEAHLLNDLLKKLKPHQIGHTLKVDEKIEKTIRLNSETQKKDLKYKIRLLIYFLKYKLRFLYTNHKFFIK